MEGSHINVKAGRKLDFSFVCLFRVSFLKEHDKKRKKTFRGCGWKRQAEMDVESGLA